MLKEPETQTSQSPLRSFQSVFSEALTFTTRRLDILGWYVVSSVGVMIAVAVLMAIGFAGFSQGIGPALIVLLGIICSIVGFTLLVCTVLVAALRRKDRLRFFSAVPFAWKGLWSVIVITFYVQLLYVPLILIPVAVLIGLVAFLEFTVPEGWGAALVLLFVPLLVVNIYLILSIYAYFIEGIKGMAALTRSITLVRGMFWQITLYLAASIIPFVVIVMALGRLGTQYATGNSTAELVVDLIANIAAACFTIFIVTFLALIAESRIKHEPDFSVARHPRLHRAVKSGLIFSFVLVVAGSVGIGYVAVKYPHLLMSDDMLSPSDESFEDILIEEYEAGLLNIPNRNVDALLDDRITMFDVWFEMDWYYQNNGEYPETLFQLDIPIVPPDITYERSADGQRYELCKESGEGCVSHATKQYPFLD